MRRVLLALARIPSLAWAQADPETLADLVLVTVPTSTRLRAGADVGGADGVGVDVGAVDEGGATAVGVKVVDGGAAGVSGGSAA